MQTGTRIHAVIRRTLILRYRLSGQYLTGGVEIAPERKNLKKAHLEKSMKLHLGSGPNKFAGWLNVDLDAPEADMHLDLRGSLPFEDKTVEFIFNEHFIEHVTREQALVLLRECHRVLNENGVLRISTPNLKFLAASYLAGNISEWDDLWQPANPCLLMNEGMRSWGHQFLYDAGELSRILSEAGFSNVKFVQWRESTINELAALETRPFHNELIVEASKSSGPAASQGEIFNADENDFWLKGVEESLLRQTKHLDRQTKLLEQALADQTAHLRSVEAESSARAQHIATLEHALASQSAVSHTLEAELAVLRSSWYERLKSAVQALRQR